MVSHSMHQHIVMRQRLLLFLAVPFTLVIFSTADLKQEMLDRNLALFGTPPPSRSPSLMEKVMAVLPVLDKVFDQADTNEDHLLTLDEYFQANGKSLLTTNPTIVAQHEETMRNWFSRADSNGNGSVDKGEYLTAQLKMILDSTLKP